MLASNSLLGWRFGWFSPSNDICLVILESFPETTFLDDQRSITGKMIVIELWKIFQCDHKWRVRACGGHAEALREPVTRPPLVVPTYPPLHFPKARAKMMSKSGFENFVKVGMKHANDKLLEVNGYGSLSSDVLSCKGKPNGPHSIGGCTQQVTNLSKHLKICPN